MSTKKAVQKAANEATFFECPHCKVCSICVSAEEYAKIEAGQQMIEVCPVCGEEVTINA